MYRFILLGDTSALVNFFEMSELSFLTARKSKTFGYLECSLVNDVQPRHNHKFVLFLVGLTSLFLSYIQVYFL